MRTGDVVDLVVHPDRLSDLVGCPVRADRIRVKPATAVIVGLVDPATSQPAGWARLLWPVARSKAAKARQRALRVGRTVHERTLPDGLLLQWGQVPTDPALVKPLHATEALTWGPDGSAPRRGRVLRHNPLRRLVVRDGDTVVRVTATPDPWGPALHDLLAAHVPLPHRLDDGRDPHVSVQRFTGGTDLARTPSLPATRAAGAALAALHAVPPGALAPALRDRAPSAAAQAEAHAALLEHLAPDLAARVRALLPRVPRLAGEPVVAHGDASPDQVLHDQTTVWLTDFDRVCLAPRAADLGSYLAVTDPDSGEALLEGYRAAGGTSPAAGQLREAKAASVVLRLADPLRSGDPGWRDAVSARLDQIEGMLR